MNSIKHLSNDTLEQETLTTARREQATTLELLNYLAEIDARKLYATRGYPSLFAYVHQVLKYSESGASERVSAMRLMQKVPEVKQALQENKITLTTAAHVARHQRQESLDAKQTAEILGQCLNKSTRQVDDILLQHSSAPIASKPDHLRQTHTDHARLSIDCDAQMLADIKQIQELSANPQLSIRDAIKQALAEKVARLKKKRGISTENKTQHQAESSAPVQAPTF